MLLFFTFTFETFNYFLNLITYCHFVEIKRLRLGIIQMIRGVMQIIIVVHGAIRIQIVHGETISQQPIITAILKQIQTKIHLKIKQVLVLLINDIVMIMIQVILMM